MPDPAPRPLNTVDDLLRSIWEIDRALVQFQRDLLPQMRRFGVDLSGWALGFGASYRRNSQDLYEQVQQRVAARGGGYLYNDLADLDNARRMAERAESLQRAGLIAARVMDTAAWAGGIYRQASARAAIMMKLLDMQKQLPTLQERVARSESRIEHFLKNDDIFFRLLAARRLASGAERQKVDHDLARVVESYRRLYESRARLAYYNAVFSVVARFDPPNFAQTMHDLQEKGVRDRQVYLLEGSAYLQRLDELIARLNWEGEYYQAGLPEGVRFFLGEGSRQLPPGAQLRSLDQAKERIRCETPSLREPLKLAQAAGYLLGQMGDPFLFSPIPRSTFYKALAGVGVLALLIVFFVTGAAGVVGAAFASLPGAAWQAASKALPVNNAGQFLALVFIGLILLIPVAWLVFLWIKKPR